MESSWYTEEELAGMGFGSVGRKVQLSRKASLYNVGRMYIGDHVRVDDFCFLSAGPEGLYIGRNVHISAYSSVTGLGKIVLEDFAGLSARVSVFSSSDDYSGSALTNPTVPREYLHLHTAQIHIGRHVIVGAGSVVLPGVTLGEGAAVGALSLVNADLEPFWVYGGVPAQKLKERQRDLLEAERRYRASES